MKYRLIGGPEDGKIVELASDTVVFQTMYQPRLVDCLNDSPGSTRIQKFVYHRKVIAKTGETVFACETDDA